jgi:hypothetical protein
MNMATSRLPSPDALIESFPTPSLPIVQGQSTFPQLAAILQALKANVASIPSNAGGGENGHLGIVVLTAVYVTIAPGNPFLPPTMPPQHPKTPRNSTDVATSTILRRHTEKVREWKEYNNVQRGLKKQLSEAIEKIYLEAHHDDNVGYEHVSIHVLIQYHFDEYGDITPINLQANAKRLDEDWDPNQPVQTLYSRIKKKFIPMLKRETKLSLIIKLLTQPTPSSTKRDSTTMIAMTGSTYQRQNRHGPTSRHTSPLRTAKQNGSSAQPNRKAIMAPTQPYKSTLPSNPKTKQPSMRSQTWPLPCRPTEPP